MLTLNMFGKNELGFAEDELPGAGAEKAIPGIDGDENGNPAINGKALVNLPVCFVSQGVTDLIDRTLTVRAKGLRVSKVSAAAASDIGSSGGAPVAPPSAPGDSGGGGNDNSDPPDDFADLRLAEFARTRGLEIIRIDDKEWLENFAAKKWTPRRRADIDEVKRTLSADDSRIRYCTTLLAEAKEAYGINVAEFEAKIMQIIDLIGDSLATKKYVEPEIAEAIQLLEKIKISGFTNGDFKNLETLFQKIRSRARYPLEADKATYRSSGFSAGALMQLYGFNDRRNMYFREDGTQRRFGSFGCGDGSDLIALARDASVQGFEGTMHSAVDEALVGADITPNDVQRVKALISSKIGKAELQVGQTDTDLDVNFLGLDMAEGFVDRLRGKYRLTARKADICAPEFRDVCTPRLKEGSLDVVNSILTVDRAATEPLIANMAQALRSGGISFIATKSRISPVSDGQGGIIAPIVYDGAVRTRDRVGTLGYLCELLEQNGLRPVRIARLPYKVICSDCKTSGPGSGPQNYNLVGIVAVKQ